MAISVFDLFSIGIGPSSSHTVGPMRAARQFVHDLEQAQLFDMTETIVVDLYGSLALTGKGHCTDMAVLLGLEGDTPQEVDPETIEARLARIRSTNKLHLNKKKLISFRESSHLIFHYDMQLPFHPNAMQFIAYDIQHVMLFHQITYSVGGGFIVKEEEAIAQKKQTTATSSKTSKALCSSTDIPFPFTTAHELLQIGRKHRLSLAQIMMENEKVWRSEPEIRSGLLQIWTVMKNSIERGCRQDGILPGGLFVPRRAKKMYETLQSIERKPHALENMEWVSLWALAVNEENAAGSRVVTAPTNGSAGVIPAVIQYFLKTTDTASDDDIVTFMLAAGAMGILFKEGASISAAEMGCMGEIGVACSMAAAGLTAVYKGTNEQIENAAEIGMEHNLGLTCDPVKGLVQIPCIERNTMGAIKAINASLLALQGNGSHKVTLDQVIKTMKQTGDDMKSTYKETSLGGLAVNVVEC